MRPTKYKSESVKPIIQVEQRVNRLGEIFYYVEFNTNDGVRHGISFSSLSSVLDFFKNNF